MRVTRLHVDAALQSGAQLQLPAGPAKHVARVLRMGPGAELRLFNGTGGEYHAVIETAQRDSVTVRIGAHDSSGCESPLRIVLLQGLARGDKMDLILQKATELGVSAIVPVQMARSTVRLDADNAEAKQRHWQSVVISACEQCGRNAIPAVSLPQGFAQALFPAVTHKVMLAPDESARGLADWLTEWGAGAAKGPVDPIALMVGPEGGLDPGESAAAMAAGFLKCRLGPRVLRTETAGLAALAALQTLAGDLR